MSPRPPRWFNSITKGSNAERDWLIKAQHQAEQEILLAAVDVRLALSDGLLADCTDLRVASTTVRWCRRERRIYAKYTVRLAHWRLGRTVSFRSPQRGKGGASFLQRAN